ncbi:RpiB/LacA/LacB family sugar-phosphate isomerase [Candidatus Woesebacteria bacterium]|nr:RpiB/LacA/LacB family sugar-phosphate isomerase [Candidatus Woesebacteria bacterium]
MQVYLGADHRGFKLKGKIKKWIEEWDYEAKDMGASEFDSKDDYTLYAEKVGSIVGKEKEARGVLLCGSGVGVDVMANKFDGVRASIGKTPEQVKTGRSDDNMNILVIAADHTKEDEAKKMVKAFLETKFEGKARQRRRLSDIEKIEANN